MISRNSRLKPAMQLAFCVLSLALAKSPGAEASSRCRDADFLVVHGKIITMKSGDGGAEAIAVRGKRILAVGSDAEVRSCAGEATRVVDLHGRTVLPGLIDVHTHALSWASQVVRGVLDLRYPNVRSIAEVRQLISQRVATVKAGEWILGSFWDDAKLDEHRYITREDLDAVSPNNPVYLTHVSGHLSVANSRALNLAGINKQTRNPQGGIVEKSVSGELTGVLKDNAQHLLETHFPPEPPETQVRAARYVSDTALSVGITTIHDVGGNMGAYQKAYQQGLMKMRVQLVPIVNNTKEAENLSSLGLHTGFGDEHVKIGAVKMFADGGMGARTIAIYPPGVNGEPSNTGLLIWKTEDMEKAQQMLAAQGWQLTTHAIGDRAIDQVLDSYAKVVRSLNLTAPRFRIVHCGISTPAIQKRLREQQVLVDGDPAFVYWIGSWFTKYGPERVRWAYPGKSYLDSGIIAGAGSDVPVTPLSPWWGIMSAVTRKEMLSGTVLAPEERLTVLQALALYTTNGAYIGFEEKDKGSLEPGKLADFIVIDRDILSIPPEDIKSVQVLDTYVDGNLVYHK
jgi:predicted amidohydrolase YtcJ